MPNVEFTASRTHGEQSKGAFTESERTKGLVMGYQSLKCFQIADINLPADIHRMPSLCHPEISKRTELFRFQKSCGIPRSGLFLLPFNGPPNAQDDDHALH